MTHPLTSRLELLSPARTADIGREAILHGADAVYIGGPAFGARHNASNSIEDIAALVSFAHRYHARIFVTLNTILHDAELELARKQVCQLYDAGVDALIIQDMGLMEMDLPPIQMHASTQTDIRTPEKARFMADAGFSQIVLARELSVAQVREIAATTDAVIEYFIHGALCVAFSGQCNISHAQTGRSANRGDCSQACRLPYTLLDAQGRVVAYEKHLLSMKDNNQTANLADLVDAGVRSFKIEGRYKDVGYVKNITAHYRQELDRILEQRPELSRASSGSCAFHFTPDPDKTFNRGATDYFATGRKIDIGAFDSPKFVGVPVGSVLRIGNDHVDVVSEEVLHNGDGLNYMHKREVIGLQVNRAVAQGEGVYRIYPNEPVATLPGLRVGGGINRNRDHAWEQGLLKQSSERRIGIWLRLEEGEGGLVLRLTDEDGCTATAAVALALEPARGGDAEVALRAGLGKLGGTAFYAHDVSLALSQPWFVPASVLNGLRRDAVSALEAARLAALPRLARKVPVDPPVAYPEVSLSFLGNVYNHKARAFYEKHGVRVIAPAYEAHEEAGEVPLMITKHCLRFSFNLCPKQAKGVKGVMGQVRAEPMTLVNGTERLTLKFDCRPCEMHVIGKMKKHILASDPPSVVPLKFFRDKPEAGR